MMPLAVFSLALAAASPAAAFDHLYYGNLLRQVIEKEADHPDLIQGYAFCYLRDQGFKGFSKDNVFTWIECDGSSGWDVGSTPTFLGDWELAHLIPPNWDYEIHSTENGYVATFKRRGGPHHFETPPLPSINHATLWGITGAIDTEWHYRAEKEWRTPYHLFLTGDPT